MMAEKPILFSAPMIRAILDGRKTQTRRAVTFPTAWGGCVTHDDLEQSGFWLAESGWHYGDDKLPKQYAVGDTLWVRETWARITDYDGQFLVGGRKALYRADGNIEPSRWRPSIFMPRWASRITLRITDVRVERLQEITEADARAEGVEASSTVELVGGEPCYTLPFQTLWTSINGIDNLKAWDENPWLWVISFEREER